MKNDPHQEALFRSGYVPNNLDRLPDDRLHAALVVMRFLNRTLTGGTKSWWYPQGTDEFQAVFDLWNVGLVRARESMAGIRVMLKRRRGRR